MKLLQHLSEIGYVDRFFKPLDMLFSCNYMGNLPKWNGGYSSLFARRIKEIAKVEVTTDFSTSEKGPVIQIREKEQMAFNCLRHIRNGIAHGHADVININGLWLIELRDYDKRKKQSAYLLLPIESLLTVFQKHDEIAMSASKKRKETTMP